MQNPNVKHSFFAIFALLLTPSVLSSPRPAISLVTSVENRDSRKITLQTKRRDGKEGKNARDCKNVHHSHMYRIRSESTAPVVQIETCTICFQAQNVQLSLQRVHICTWHCSLARITRQNLRWQTNHDVCGVIPPPMPILLQCPQSCSTHLRKNIMRNNV